jgi:3-oxoacyl-[acyl-carrier protein] reductase
VTASLKGKTAIVTGASRGIGLAIGKALAREGVRLGFLSRSRPEVGGEFVSCDLAQLDQIPAAVGQLRERLGTIDFLINNAGAFLERPVLETQSAEWEQIHRVNLAAPFVITREVLQGMIERRDGRILFIASSASVQGYFHQAAYSASKHGLLGFARSLALEVKTHNIRVHTLCPGGVETDLIKGTRLGKRLKGEPMIQPKDIADMVLFLLRQPPGIDIPEVIIRRFIP